jgi:hypothetical protein
LWERCWRAAGAANAFGVMQAEAAAGFKIEVAVAPSGAAGFGDGGESWTLGVLIGAWRVPGGALSMEPLYVKRPGLKHDELRPLQDRLRGLALAKLHLSAAPEKVRYPSGHERWEAVLETIEATEVDDRELLAWVEEKNKPIVIRDEVLGALTLDRTRSYYLAERTVGGVGYEIMIGLGTEPDSRRDAAKIKALRGIVTAVEAGVPRYREAAVDELLEDYNAQWRNEDDPRLSRAEFASRLTLDSIHIEPRGKIDVYFRDGDLFAGHFIELRLDTPDRVRSIGLAG